MEYFVIINNEQQGPFTVDELAARGIHATTPVWCEGMADWTVAGLVNELSAAVVRDEPPRVPQNITDNKPTTHQQPYTSRIPPEWHGNNSHNTQQAANPWQQNAASEQYAHHTAQQQYGTTGASIVGASKRKSNKGWWIALGITLLMLLILVLTNPDRSDHREAVSSVLNEWKNDKIGGLAGGFVGEVMKMGGDFAITTSVNKMLDVHNYIIFSTGHLDLGIGKPIRVSFGILGHVFTFNKEKLDEQWKTAISKIIGLEQDNNDNSDNNSPSINIVPDYDNNGNDDNNQAQDLNSPNEQPEASSDENDLNDPLDEFDELDRAMRELEALTGEKIEQMADSAYNALKKEVKRKMK